MATLTGKQLKDSYQSLVTIKDADDANPTSGRLENGKGTALTAVGINTDAPANKIGIKTAVNTNERAINLYSGTTVAGNYVSIGSQYSEANANVNSEIRFGGENAGGAPSYLAFATGTSTSSTERLRVKSSGDISFRDTSTNEAFYWDASTARLGIGETSPSSELHIKRTTGNVGIQIETGDGSDTYINFGDSADSNVGLISYEHDNNAFAFRTNAQERIRIDSSGNVGIGVTPDRALHVNGSVRINDGYSLSMGAGAEQRILAGGTSNSTYLTFSQWTGASFTERMRILSSGGITFNGDTATANALDDYEEGTFTPSFDSVTVSYTSQSGKYTKIGRLVQAEYVINVSSIDNTDASVINLNLPFNASADSIILGQIDMGQSSLMDSSPTPSGFNSSGAGTAIELSNSTTVYRYNNLTNTSGLFYLSIVYTAS